MPKAKLDLDKKPTIEILVLNMKTVTSLFFFFQITLKLAI